MVVAMAVSSRKRAAASIVLRIFLMTVAIGGKSSSTAAFVIRRQPAGSVQKTAAVGVPRWRGSSSRIDSSSNSNNDDDLPEFDLPEEKRDADAERLQQQAEQLRQQIRDMEAKLGTERKRNYEQPSITTPDANLEQEDGMTLRNKRVLVTGANGRVGSMVCRYLLRNYPQIKELIAAVHVVGENSSTSRGYGRLSYEVGAEDGIGSIGAAWDSEERTQTFQFDPETMGDYNLNKLRIVECELLDPVQCSSITEDVDSVIWCATDFNGNTPRAVSGLNIAFLFRAVASPTKGRVEIEGLQNMLGALKTNKLDRKRRESLSSPTTVEENPNDPLNVVLVSMVPEAFPNYETPFGEFNAIKRESEQLLESFPSLTHTVLQMGQYNDNFLEEGQPITFGAGNDDSAAATVETKRRQINRRDAAKAAVDALAQEELISRIVPVYTAIR